MLAPARRERNLSNILRRVSTNRGGLGILGQAGSSAFRNDGGMHISDWSGEVYVFSLTAVDLAMLGL